MTPNSRLSQLFTNLGSLLALCIACPAQTTNTPAAADPARYEVRQQHDPDGIGKFFMGREIAHVMGHQAADWLERPEREQEERPDLLLPALKIKAGDAVADIGAGNGYYTRRLAKLAGQNGTVYAVVIQPGILALFPN